MSYEDAIPDSEKINIASEFLLNAPPGEFNEVFNDVRVLMDNDQLLKSGAAAACGQYNCAQFTVVELPDGSNTLVTVHGKLSDGVFYDPRTRQQFEYDHLRRIASNLSSANINSPNESLRKAVESVVDAYVKEHFPTGTSAVYGLHDSVVVCIEGHKFNPTNFWNGRWRSEWTLSVGSGAVTGKLKVQVHYYEDGNVQLSTSKDVDGSVSGGDQQMADQFSKLMKKSESDYQEGINENYGTMSGTTFKALRRVLPITKTKVDWNKIVNYKLGKDLKG